MWGNSGYLPGFAECKACGVAWKAPLEGQARCWLCGRFGKRRAFIYMYGPQSVKFEEGQGPVDPPYLNERSEDAAYRSH